MDKKKQVLESLKWQIITWSSGLVVFILLSFAGSQNVEHNLTIAALIISILVLLSPFFGIKSFIKIFDGTSRKIIAGVLFVVVLELITFSFFEVITVAGWESKYDRDSKRDYILNEPKRKAAEERIYKIKSEKEAFKHVSQAIVRKRNHECNDLGFFEYGVLIDFLEKNRKRFGNENTVQMLLMLHQFQGAADGEWLAELIPEIMLEDPGSVIRAQLKIKGFLLPEFQDEKIIEGIRNCGCGLPGSYYERKTQEERERIKADMRLRLKKLINDSNKEYVMYLITTCFKAGEK
jgi:hypothetical protein